jgi:hypothetical protein
MTSPPSAQPPAPSTSSTGPPDDWTFRVDALTKQFGALAANDDITLRVEPGEG